MTAIHVDATLDGKWRDALYEGSIFVLSPNSASIKFCSHAAAMIEDAFGGVDPRIVQRRLPVEQFASIVAPLKTAFIHHPVSKTLVADILRSLGCDEDRTYFDVPRLRIATSDGYLNSGVAYAHHPHRDTWYAAPMCQVNWWVPIYPIEPSNAMAFHPRYFGEVVDNDSALFNYYDWNANQRRNAALHIKHDTRWQPHALTELDLEPEVRVIPRVGGLILFSGAQLHSTVPNTSGVTRWSIDFRTIDLEDVRRGRGAPNVDSQPRGTALRDFMRLGDGARMEEDIVRGYDGPGPHEGELVFQPQGPG